MISASLGKSEVANVLLGNGANATARCAQDHGRTPLHFAAIKGKTAVVRSLLETHHLDIQAQDDNSDTPLHLAVENGHLELVQYLVSKSADKTAPNKNEETPVQVTVRKGLTEIAKLLH
ncbi:hypothetical protein HK405_005442 [Cladochytrium tenue]|nr:hypothetical protein HK405_005442 [Cladochytrium tenue]